METNCACKAVEIVKEHDIKFMLENAKNKISNWNHPSNLNKTMSKGAVWNLVKNAKIDHPESDLELINCIREFGEFLPEDVLDKIKPAWYFHHEEPIF
jgi:hypothetical protein